MADDDSVFPEALRAQAFEAVENAKTDPHLHGNGNGRAYPSDFHNPREYDFDDPNERTKPGFGPGNGRVHEEPEEDPELTLELNPELPPPAFPEPVSADAALIARVAMAQYDIIGLRLDQGTARFEQLETKIQKQGQDLEAKVEKLGLDNDVNFVALNKSITESNAMHERKRLEQEERDKERAEALKKRDADLMTKIDRGTPGPIVIAIVLLMGLAMAGSGIYIAYSMHVQQQQNSK